MAERRARGSEVEALGPECLVTVRKALNRAQFTLVQIKAARDEFFPAL